MLSYKELQQLLRVIPDEEENRDGGKDEDEKGKSMEKKKQKMKEKEKEKQKIKKQSSKSIQKEGKKGSKQKISLRYELVLTHRELRKVPLSIPFREYPIQRLDLSFNYLKDLKTLKDTESKDLQYLGLGFNFLTSLENIGNSFTNLKVIDANANRIESLNIKEEEFPTLEALYLKNNKIKYFLHCPKSVQILCLDHNQLSKLAFSGGDNLQILSASSNKIQQFQLEASKGEKICFLDLEENLLHDMMKFKKMLLGCQNLLSLNMMGNYVSKLSHKKYMVEVLAMCPKLVKVDEQYINPHVREAFKIMKQQDLIELQMKQTEEKYLKRMEEQLKLKEEMMEKIRSQQKQLQDNFRQFMKTEKEQMDVLQSYAKNNMGKKKLAIIHRVQVSLIQKPFKQMATNYNKEEGESPRLKLEQSNCSGTGSMVINAQEESGGSGHETIQKHRNQYRQYKKSKQNSGRETKVSKIQSYSKIDPKQQVDVDSKSEGSEEEQLSSEEVERRKKNMRNPNLVYRNSNELIGIKESIIEELGKSDGEEQVFNPKCLPYLVRKYGFHTVV